MADITIEQMAQVLGVRVTELKDMAGVKHSVKKDTVLTSEQLAAIYQNQQKKLNPPVQVKAKQPDPVVAPRKVNRGVPATRTSAFKVGMRVLVSTEEGLFPAEVFAIGERDEIIVKYSSGETEPVSETKVERQTVNRGNPIVQQKPAEGSTTRKFKPGAKVTYIYNKRPYNGVVQGYKGDLVLVKVEGREDPYEKTEDELEEIKPKLEEKKSKGEEVSGKAQKSLLDQDVFSREFWKNLFK